uniref:Amidase domain-containing protein n=1 Tax=Rhabditophanes sp. KR3021 TaxID=114890 RepID=A0AC35TNT5_9BILA
MPLLLPSILIDSEYVYSLPKWIILIFQLIHNVFCASVNVFFNLLNSMKDKKKVPMITDPLLLKSAVECGRLIREGRLTSTLLVNAYIKRQQEVNHLLNAVAVENYEFALKKAAETDLYISTLDKKSDEFKNLKDKPLLGVPFTLKCSIKAFGYNPTASIVALNNRPPMNEECPLVSSLKNAGALIICYSTCPELRWNIETNSKLYGRCCNPYDVRRTSGASSSGEGSIIGAGASLMGIGSDIAGSIRIPAAFCGIFSYKPSSKALNGEGHEPGAPEGAPVLEMAHIGPMARYAQDLHFMTKLMMTKDKLEELKMNEKVEFKDLKFFYIKDFSYMESEKVSDDMLLGLDSVVKMINAEGNSICEIVLDELKHANEYWQV